MKKIIVSAMCVMLAFTVAAQKNTSFKTHNFGVGLSSVLSSSTNPYLKYKGATDFNGSYGKISSNMDLVLSGRYEYAFNKSMYLGTGLSYRLNSAEIFYNNLSTSVSSESTTIHDLEIPLYFDYKTALMPNINLFAGAGISGTFNLSLNSDLVKKDSFSPYLLLRTGFDFLSNHRVQFLLQYRINLNSSMEYVLDPSYPMDREFKVNTFDVGINFFF
ncbi:MAG: outer membrane beta-barrel protein [Bacteroidales bacterium]|nr:outer membrane beta-barrel protein [Bacteroidales bacterium]